MFKLTSLNLNGIRSAATKGVESWIAQTSPDCICVQEVKAQHPDVHGKHDTWAGLKGHFHFAEKKGYSGVGAFARHEPSDVVGIEMRVLADHRGAHAVAHEHDAVRSSLGAHRFHGASEHIHR